MISPGQLVGFLLAFAGLCATVIMAFCYKDLLGEFIPAHRVDYYLEQLIGHKILQVIDVAMLDEDDIVSLTSGTGDAPRLLVPFWVKARSFMGGYASMSARAASVCAVPVLSPVFPRPLPSVCPAGPLQPSSSSRSSAAKSVMSNLAAATKRASLRFVKPP